VCEKNGIENEKPVRIFVICEYMWRDEGDWRLRARPTCFYIHSQAGPTVRKGNGTLTVRAPASEPMDLYEYDPENPVPTHGPVRDQRSLGFVTTFWSTRPNPSEAISR
jgi:predicted acyl esterase